MQISENNTSEERDDVSLTRQDNLSVNSTTSDAIQLEILQLLKDLKITATTHAKEIRTPRITITITATRTTRTKIGNVKIITTAIVTIIRTEIEIITTTTDVITTIIEGIRIATTRITIQTIRITQITTTTTTRMEVLVIRVIISRIQRNIVILVALGTTKARTVSEKGQITTMRRHLKTKWVGVRETVPTQTTDAKIQGKI